MAKRPRSTPAPTHTRYGVLSKKKPGLKAPRPQIQVPLLLSQPKVVTAARRPALFCPFLPLRLAAASTCAFMHSCSGADGETRTLTAFATAPSRRRVYQFHHVGMNRLETQPCRLRDSLPRPNLTILYYYFGTSFALEVPASPDLPAEFVSGAADLAASGCPGAVGTAG